MTYDFSGRTVVVTGGGHGLGQAMCTSFAGCGAKVWTCDLDQAELEETLAICDGGCEARVVDVANRSGVRGFIEEASAQSGGVDVLVNNAGGVVGQVGKPLEEVSAHDWQVILDVNLTGAFNFSQAVSGGMKKERWGRIVNISSGAGLRASLTGVQAYAAAKAGLIGFTRQLAHELGPFGVTANCVAPGFVRSNATTERQWRSYGPDGQQRLIESIALRRLGRPEDITHAVMFFASEAASWITGQTLSVDGGR